MLKNAPPSTFWSVPIHDWGHRLTVWAENPTNRINFSRRMQRERSRMPKVPMLRDRGFAILGFGILEKCPEHVPKNNCWNIDKLRAG